ncbi:MAG: hypothetical protein IJ538_00075 [Clostridia bacterium]|nr:hypothetical protein [Clostridia bacterium]
MTKENEINEFIRSVDDMLASKYIMVDRKISDILLSIAKSKSVYNVIAECMINFDFVEEWNRATQGTSLKLPNTASKRVSFIFCLLNNIDDGNLEITYILDKYFSANPKQSPYENFCLEVILEFKRLMLEFLGYSHEKDITAPIETADETKFKTLEALLLDLLKEVKTCSKLKKCSMEKENIIAVISTYIYAVSERQQNYFYAFLLTLKAELGKDKRFANKLVKIEELSNSLIRG